MKNENVIYRFQQQDNVHEIYIYDEIKKTRPIGFDFNDLDGNVYFYTIPALKLTADPISPTGIDEDIMEELEWSALRDPQTACQLQIDRFSSVFPV